MTGKSLHFLDDTGEALIVDGIAELGKGRFPMWVATPLGRGCLLLTGRDGENVVNTDGDQGGFCSTELFFFFLQGIVARQWTGALAVDMGFGVKRLFFVDGNFVFGASTTIDDRLGEVLYREGLISLDDLMISASQVTRETKFGQVLVNSKIMSNLDLLRALQSQACLILKSVFMSDQVSFLARSGSRPGMELVFPEGTSELLGAAYAQGCIFRHFNERVSLDAKISLNPRSSLPETFARGTFRGDLVDILKANPTVMNFVNETKLSKPYALASVMELTQLEVCLVETLKHNKFERGKVFLLPLKEAIENFERILELARAAFGEVAKELPIADMRGLAESLNDHGINTIFLDENGNIHEESLQGILGHCEVMRNYVGFYETRVHSLTRFLIQICGDHLDREAVRLIKQELHE